MRVLGIDPGLKTIGLGLVERNGEKLSAIEWLTIETDAGLPLPDRLCEIQRDLDEYVRETKPDLVVVETLFFQTNTSSAMQVAHARGVILSVVAKHGIAILEANPLELKRSVTGDGRADKTQMQDMVMRTLSLTQRPTPDDAADALSLALHGCFAHARLDLAA